MTDRFGVVSEGGTGVGRSAGRPERPRNVVIVGAGLSGTMVAANLLRRSPSGTRITLIERKPPFARGVAYGTLSPVHRLNVMAGKLSVWPDQPRHFVEWAARHEQDPGVDEPVLETDFLPRYLFGRYLSAVLHDAQQSANADVSLRQVTGEVVDVIDEPERVVILEDGEHIDADVVVLALGNLPGEYPIRDALPIYQTPRYMHVPWLMGAVESIKPDDDVLLVGAGLTAVDIVLQLDAQGHRGKIHALSRRGLRPRSHSATASYEGFLQNRPMPDTIRGTVRLVREEIERAREKGIDWRAVLDSMRPFTQALWKGFSIADRARFMRHVRPFWDTHRHRLAPVVAKRIEQIERAGGVSYYAGRLQVLEERPDGVHATFRSRSDGSLTTLVVGKVINCTGPRIDYSKFQHPLFINLLARGLIDHDPLLLGINATEQGEVYRYEGEPSTWLYTLGSPMVGVLWECTAVPEIRTQAAMLAERILRAEVVAE